MSNDTRTVRSLIVRLLSVLLSVALVVQGVPIVPALGDDSMGETSAVNSAETNKENEVESDTQQMGTQTIGANSNTQLNVTEGGNTTPGTVPDVTPGETPDTTPDVTPGKTLETNEVSGAPASGDPVEMQEENQELLSVESAEASLAQSTPVLTTASTETVSEQIQTQVDLGASATSFSIRGERGNASRTAQVKYVDQFKKPLYGTVTGVVTLRYDNTGVPNDVNSIDLYTFADKLDPSISDDYEFSRVYLALSSDDKDFRYLCVSTDRDIQGSGGTSTRMYTYLNDIKTGSKYGGTYYGMWYTLPSAGNSRTDVVSIEFNHVANVAFDALDSEGGPVAGAQYALYSDEICYTEFEYKDRTPGASDDAEHVPVVAVSDAEGAVSFGKIPYGTYYMKETSVPEGYKDAGSVYKIVVGDQVSIYKASANGYESVKNVVHEWDDGSVILHGLQSMTVKKQWADDEADGESHHASDSVTVEIYSQSVVNGAMQQGEKIIKTLNHGNNWTETVYDLDPKLSYVVEETGMTTTLPTGVSWTDEWVPSIESVPQATQTSYYRADAFKKGEEYVLATSDGRALSGSGGTLELASVSIAGDEASGVENDMLWKVERINNDGVIRLRNVANNKYLNFVSSTWSLSDDASQFVRHTNSDGDINVYYRENTNASSQYYLTFQGDSILTTTKAPSPALFEIYQKIDVQSVEVTVTNRQTTYPIMMKNVYAPEYSELPGSKYTVYDKSEYESNVNDLREATPYDGMTDLTAGEDGFLVKDGSTTKKFDLQADTYYLVNTQEASGYRSFAPVRFIVTRGGMLWAQQDLPDYDYTATHTMGEKTYPVLQIPNFKVATVQVSKTLEDRLSTGSEQFEFKLTLKDNEQKRVIAGWEYAEGGVTDANGEVSFTLGNGGAKTFELPVGAHVLVEETTKGYVTKTSKKVLPDSALSAPAERGRSYNSRVDDEDVAVTFSNIRAVCKIEDGEKVEGFESLNAALEYAQEYMGGKATIQLLLGTYDMPAEDVVTIGTGYDVVITTADKDASDEFQYLGDEDTAVIRRGDSGTSLFTVSGGSLTLGNVVLDGNKENKTASGNGGLVYVGAGTLAAGSQTQLRNSKTTADGGGGALYVADGARAELEGTTLTGNAATSQGADVYLEPNSKLLLSGDVQIKSTSGEVGALYLAANAAGTEIEVADELTSNAKVYVWAEDATRDGLGMEDHDEWFGTSTATATSVKGLEHLIDQRADSDASVTAAPGPSNQIVWTVYAPVEVTLEVEGTFADTRKEFGITLTVPNDTPEVKAEVNGEERTFTAGSDGNTLELAHGQKLVLQNARKFDTYVLTQTDSQVSPSLSYDDGLYDPSLKDGDTNLLVAVRHVDDKRVVTLSELEGTNSNHATVTIVNHLGDDEVPSTGLDDNVSTWGKVAVACVCLLGVLKLAPVVRRMRRGKPGR